MRRKRNLVILKEQRKVNYKEAREYLDRVSVSGSILGLDSIRALMDELGNPQDELRIVHIAGTNGKGSILTYVRSILGKAGYSVGTYSSPSVFGYLERFQIDGEWMDESELPEYVEKAQKAVDRMLAKGLAHPTVFEIETAVAFLYFEDRGCDYVILETGMGGDLDSTNVIARPLVCAFASISMDHIGVRGDALEEIAACKSGIIKPGASVITGPQRPEVMAILKEKAECADCRLTETSTIMHKDSSLDGQSFVYNNRIYCISLLGRHQQINAAVAIEIAEALRQRGVAIEDENIAEGLSDARWPGRLEVIRKSGRMFILDGAHNEAAARALSDALTELLGDERIDIVMGVFRDKEYEVIAGILEPHIRRCFCTRLPNAERSLSAEELQAVMTGLGVSCCTEPSIADAIGRACGTTLITGSLSLLADAKRAIEELD